jgi:hypothetical protein
MGAPDGPKKVVVEGQQEADGQRRTRRNARCKKTMEIVYSVGRRQMKSNIPFLLPEVAIIRQVKMGTFSPPALIVIVAPEESIPILQRSFLVEGGSIE